MLVIDCCTLNCPEPVIKCKDILSTNRRSKVQVLVDNKPALENVSRLLENLGYRIITSQDQEKLWVIHGILESIAENSQVQPKQVSENGLADVLSYKQFDAKQKTIVFISSEVLGQGDDELGHKLMESFLSTLSEIDLWQIILVNGGVKLTALAGKALESLKKLEANNVRILVCGACLNHYNLFEQKQVGETTNMLDIVTALDLADKIIRP